MEVKMFVCVVCGKEVSKRQSLACTHNGVEGRACRIHQEALAHKEAVEKSIRDAREREARIERERAERSRQMADPEYHRQEAIRMREWSETHCWACGKEGIQRRPYAMRMLIAEERLRLKGIDSNPLVSQKALFNEMGLGDRVPITDFPAKRDDKLFRPDFDAIVSLLGNIRMCERCAANSGRTNFREVFFPEVSEEQLRLGVTFSEIMKPVWKTLAAGELQEEAAKN